MIDRLVEHPVALASALTCVSFFYSRIARWRRSSGVPYPPGPRGYPIIGNLFDIGNNDRPWENYGRIAKKYGDIVFYESLGTTVLVVSSVERAVDLLEGRSSVYSSRPYLPMLCGEMGFDTYFGVMPYGPMWRRQRRVFHQHFNLGVIPRYRPTTSREGMHLLQNLTTSSGRLEEVIGLYFTRLVVKSTWGFEIKDNHDPFVVQGLEVMEAFLIAGVPGTFLIDIIPALHYLPRWFPGTGWRAWAEHHRALSKLARYEPFQRVLEEYREGKAEPSVATRMIESLPPVGDPKREEEEAIVRDTLGTTYLAAYDTSLAAGLTFIFLLAMYPEIQKKAQAEIDQVVGVCQIPTFEDRPKLVYLNALMREAFRWHCEAPVGLPHATSEDDVYDGYFIPKGTIVLANIWCMLGNPDHYPNPEEFNPERHIKDGEIDKDVLDPFTVGFGFGRRICPGRYFALDSLYILATSLLSCFDVASPKDEAGNPTMNTNFKIVGGVRTPEDLQCIVTPRSDRHAEMIQNLDLY